MTTTEETTGDRIKQYRKLQGYTQTELATMLNTDVSVVNRWEKDKNFPSLIFLEKLAAQGLNIDWLVTGHGEMRRVEIDADNFYKYFEQLEPKLKKLVSYTLSL
jgi:transcriptional regulator with XRE-family HTH domain